MTKTAVEWLIEMISYTSKDTHSAMESSKFFEQALEMEKEQGFKAFQKGCQLATDSLTLTNEMVQNKNYRKETPNEQQETK